MEQDKLISYRTATHYKYEYKVPRYYLEAM